MKKRRSKIDNKTIIRDFRETHGDKYDYSQVEYVTMHHKVKITCHIHGEFEQTPNSHKRGRGCPKCGIIKNTARQRDTTEKFIKKAKKIHGNKYDYSKTIYLNNAHDKVKIICTKHGEFKQAPNSHLSGMGCRECGVTQLSILFSHDTERFVKSAIKLHGTKYNYSLVEYSKSRLKVSIICPDHGVFKQKPNSHLTGSGCPKCNRPIGYTRSRWVKYCTDKGSMAKLYVIKCYNETESFIKVGITYKTVKKRFSRKSAMPYSYEVLKVIKSKDAGYIYDLENRVQSALKKRRYKPLISFGGETECFTHINLNKNPPS